MKNLSFCLLLLPIFIISCQKDDGGTTTPPVADKYMSLSAGSTWNYELINNTPPAATTTYVLGSASTDTTINGKTYHVFTNGSGTGNEYYNITGNDYYNFRKLPDAFGGSSVEYIYLKDNAAVGATWSQTYPVTASGIALNAILTNTIQEKGISLTVKGNTYTNVIHVTTTITATIGGAPLPGSAIVTDIQSYYAPKVGSVQSLNKINFDFSGVQDSTNQQTNLVSSDIK